MTPAAQTLILEPNGRGQRPQQHRGQRRRPCPARAADELRGPGRHPLNGLRGSRRRVQQQRQRCRADRLPDVRRCTLQRRPPGHERDARQRVLGRALRRPRRDDGHRLRRPDDRRLRGDAGRHGHPQEHLLDHRRRVRGARRHRADHLGPDRPSRTGVIAKSSAPTRSSSSARLQQSASASMLSATSFS